MRGRLLPNWVYRARLQDRFANASASVRSRMTDLKVAHDPSSFHKRNVVSRDAGIKCLVDPSLRQCLKAYTSKHPRARSNASPVLILKITSTHYCRREEGQQKPPQCREICPFSCRLTESFPSCYCCLRPQLKMRPTFLSVRYHFVADSRRTHLTVYLFDICSAHSLVY